MPEAKKFRVRVCETVIYEFEAIGLDEADIHDNIVDPCEFDTSVVSEIPDRCIESCEEIGDPTPEELARYSDQAVALDTAEPQADGTSTGGDAEPESKCQNCRTVWPDSKLEPIKDLTQRVAPGEPLPSGECPECGALCQPIGTCDESQNRIESL